MGKIDVHSNSTAANETAGPRMFSKPQSLRLEKQTIRTLTGPELKLVGGGGNGTSCCTCHSNATK
jgi:hypothetical protein